MAVMSHQTSGSVAKWSQGFQSHISTYCHGQLGLLWAIFSRPPALASPEQWILPQQAEDAEDVMEASSSLSTEERLSCEWIQGFWDDGGNGMCFPTCSHAVSPCPSQCLLSVVGDGGRQLPYHGCVPYTPPGVQPTSKHFCKMDFLLQDYAFSKYPN